MSKELNDITTTGPDIKVNKHKKIFIFPIAIMLLIIGLIAFQSVKYNNLMINFKTYFSEGNYKSANNYLITNQKFNIIKSFRLIDDLKVYFKETLNSLNNKVNSKEISADEAFVIINEINHYNLLNTEIDESVSVVSKNISNDSPLTRGIAEYQNGNYEIALSLLKSIKTTESFYPTAMNYISKCKISLKNSLLEEAEALSNKNYYSKAIDMLEKNLSILDNDSEISDKINSLKKSREDYLNKNNGNNVSKPTSSILSTISASNINTLYLESLTPYLIYVDIASQNTYVYSGSMNKWDTKKVMKCSTGIDSEKTPSGVFTIDNKGDWFFSSKYQQGGKFWVQFKGDYLFHSLPFANDKETIVDYTLGTPASHGCIRLSLEDSKWIYDNIPRGTKVIIK